MRPLSGWLTTLAWLLAAGCVQHVRPVAVVEEARDAARDILAEEAVRLYFERQQRLTRVAAPLRIAGTALCGDDVAPYIGIVIWRRPKQLSDFAFFEAANRLYGDEPGAMVVGVVPDSPAETAGVRSGDRIVAVNGEAVTRSVRWFEMESDFFDRFHEEPDTAPRLSLVRSGDTLDVTLQRVDACRWQAILYPSQVPDTDRGNHRHMDISAGMIRVSASDQELAAAIGHQLGHMIVGGRRGSYSRNEPRADRLGLYLMERAGFDPTVAPALWERLTLDRPWAILFDGALGQRDPPHGRMPERMLAMRATLAEIAQKKARGEPLVPGRGPWP